MDQYMQWQPNSGVPEDGALTDAQLDELLSSAALDSLAPAADLNFEDFADFSKHLPTFVKPAEPCEYCTSKKLDCHMYFGKVTCTACDSLFRPCSFTHTVEPSAFPGQGTLDTLHVVNEDAPTEWGAVTGTKQMRSKATKTRPDTSKKPPSRFSLAAIKTLKTWFDSHREYPYPSEEEKLELERSTGLKPAQISTWLANTRRRTKPSPVRVLQAPAEPSVPIEIKGNASATKEWSDLNPLQRWQHSPPENEPARFDDIKVAVETSTLAQDVSSSSSSGRLARSGSGTSSARREPSITSLETSRESTQSKSSIAWSHGSGSSFGSFGSGLHGKRDRQRKRKSRLTALRRGDAEIAQRPMQCTFCCDRFKTKYDWTRHEKTLHLSLEKWTCAPNGPIETDPVGGAQVCAYCRLQSPDAAHIESHSHSDCTSKGIEARIFFRKDHLRQHLRLVHQVPLAPHMESWKTSDDAIKSRCGFCEQRFTSWAERNDHLANHFRHGAQMSSWKRCHGLDPEVAAHVLNAMPPYMIGVESLSAEPFSATNSRSCCPDLVVEATPRRNQEQPTHSSHSCWEVLTVHLAKYITSEATRSSAPITDAQIAAQARRILYSDDDAWNQTPIDNPAFMDLFKKAYCHDMIPSVIGGVGSRIPGDLELYTDLGMRVPYEAQVRAVPGASSGPNYEELPLLASRMRRLAEPPMTNPVVEDEQMPSAKVGQQMQAQDPLEFINQDMLESGWEQDFDFGELTF